MYTYNDLFSDLHVWENRGAAVSYPGQAVSGKLIPAVKVGFGAPRIVVQAAIHARENITALIVREQVFRFLEFAGFARRSRTTPGTVWFVPVVNIDGAELCERGLSAIADPLRREFLLKLNGARGGDFSEWKANLNGVDLNVNFPADWGTGTHNVFEPAPENYIGREPASEPETKALLRLTEEAKPDLTLSYHARGREIYWEFGQAGAVRRRDARLARLAAQETGYKLVNSGAGSAGGYKDYCVQSLNIPALTLETCDENAPFPLREEDVSYDIERNRALPEKLIEALSRGF